MRNHTPVGAALVVVLAVSGCDGSIEADPSRADSGADGGSPAADSGIDSGVRTDRGTDAGRRDAGGGDAGLDAGSPVDAGGGPSDHPFGIGLVGPGSTGDLDLAADLAGPGGFVKLIFPGITRDTSGPSDDWVRAVREAHDRDLIPVIRLAPPWGDRNVRSQADDGAGGSFGALADAHRRVVEGLPLREGWPLWLEIHNEPNLCYEWTCDAGSVAGDWLGHEQIAHEYARMLRDVADALHAIGDGRIRVINGGLAPGGARRCRCGSDDFEAGVTAADFLREMRAEVPDVFDRLDGLATHSYPAEGEGWGFFVPYDRAGPGLRYYERELEIVGRDLPVLITETGWCVPGSRCAAPSGSREDVAAWTVRAYEELWLVDDRIHAVMPFMLRDAGWEDFAWVAAGGGPHPVYDRVRALRCSTIPGRCP